MQRQVRQQLEGERLAVAVAKASGCVTCRHSAERVAEAEQRWLAAERGCKGLEQSAEHQKVQSCPKVIPFNSVPRPIMRQ